MICYVTPSRYNLLRNQGLIIVTVDGSLGTFSDLPIKLLITKNMPLNAELIITEKLNDL